MNDGSLDVLVAGAGRVGHRPAKMLDDYGHSVTVIEEDPHRCEVVADEYVATPIQGDASPPDVLRQADLDDQDAVSDLRIVEIRVQEGAPVAGKRLEQVAFPSGSTVISDADNDHIAGAEMELTPGRTYLVATEPGVADEVVNLMRG